MNAQTEQVKEANEVIDPTTEERILIEGFTGFYLRKDWNGLMKVVTKIESLGYYTSILYLRDDEPEKGYQVAIWGGNYRSIPFPDPNITKIQAVYKAVLAFITWYNSIKKA